MTSDTGTLITQQRYLPFGAERTNIGVITQTDLGYTGQRDLGLGLMDYHARFYSPYLSRFIQPDTLIPDPVNPQAWNRYSYVGNRPVNFNDPTGHKACDDEFECGWNPKLASNSSSSKDKDKKFKNGLKDEIKGDDPGCTTVTCRAIDGDVSAIFDLLIPTHFGWRGQIEISLTVGKISLGPSGTLGVNFAYNRVSGEIAAFADWTEEAGVSASLYPIGASLTEGPIVGWGSSTVKDVAQGDSGIISATAAYEAAASVSVSAPMNGLTPIVDPVYGQIPATLYSGTGIGYAYGGLGVGVTHVFASSIIDLSP